MKTYKSKNQEQNVLKYIVDWGELKLDQRDYHAFDKFDIAQENLSAEPNHVRLKPTCSVTGTSWKIEIL